MRLDFCLLSGKKNNSSEVLHVVSKLQALEYQPSKVLGCIKKIISSILKSTKFKSNDRMTKIEEYFKSDSVNDEWEQKKKLYGFTDDIKNTKLYQLLFCI
jgi:hypothetical protein